MADEFFGSAAFDTDKSSIQTRGVKDAVLLNSEECRYVLNTKKPVMPEESTDEQNKQLQSWIIDDYICKNFILDGICNEMYDYYNLNLRSTAAEV